MDQLTLRGGHTYTSTIVHSGVVVQGDIHHHNTPTLKPNIFKRSNYEAFKDANPHRVPGTCQWVLQHPHFVRWRDDRDSKLLWISADPGCGKSVLAKTLVDDRLAVQGLENEASIPIVFQFFKDVGEQKSVTSALCALLHQLYSIPTIWKACQELVASLIDVHGMSILTNFPVLWKLFLDSAGRSSSKAIICVLDALDECQPNDRKILVKELEKLTGTQTETKVKFLVTSRPYHQIMYDFKVAIDRIPTIHLAGEEETESIKTEIDIVMRQKIDDISVRMGLTQLLKERLLRKLQSIEHRTYLWLSLIFEEIEQLAAPTEKELLGQIETLPTSIEEIYENILGKSTNREAAHDILGLVTMAYAPLTLDELELLFLLRVNRPTLSEYDFRGAAQFKAFARSTCGLFLMVVDERVYLIHLTAKEFLLRQQDNMSSGWVFRGCVRLDEFRCKMAIRCMLALVLAYRNEIDRVGQEATSSIMGLAYPLRYWLNHTRDCQALSSETVATTFETLIANVPVCSKWGRKVHDSKLRPADPFFTDVESPIGDELDYLLFLEERSSRDNTIYPELRKALGDALVFVMAVAHDLRSISRSYFRPKDLRLEKFRRWYGTALCLLVLTSNHEFLEEFLRLFPDMVNIESFEGMTPIDYGLGVFRNSGSTRCLSILIEASARVSYRIQSEMNEYQGLRIDFQTLWMSEDGTDTEPLRLLLRAGLDPGGGLFNRLLEMRHLETLKSLLRESSFQTALGSSEEDVSENALATQMSLLFHRAVVLGFLETAEELLGGQGTIAPIQGRLCCLCEAFKHHQLAFFPRMNQYEAYLTRRPRFVCEGLGPLPALTARRDLIALERALRYGHSWQHYPSQGLAFSWSVLLAVAYDYVDALELFRAYQNNYSTPSVSNHMVPISQDIVDMCSQRRFQITNRLNLTRPNRLPPSERYRTTPMVKDGFRDLIIWTLGTTRALTGGSRNDFYKDSPQQKLFGPTAQANFLWCFQEFSDMSELLFVVGKTRMFYDGAVSDFSSLLSKQDFVAWP